MNPKILLAFVGGAAVAGLLAVVLTRGGEVPQVREIPATETALSIERPVESASGQNADIAAGMEALPPPVAATAPRPARLPKPAPVQVKPSKVAEPSPVTPPPVEAPVQAPVQARNEVILPPFSSPQPEPPKVFREEPQRAEIMKPDTVAKPPAARVPETVTVPAGTTLSVRLSKTLNSEKNQAGESFTATLESPLVVDDIVLAERGARVEGKLMEVDRSGRVKGAARLALALTRIQLSDGQRVALATDSWERVAESSRKSDAVKVGVMAGIGAAIGAIAGGGKGAAVGAASGGGAGTGVVLATRGKPAQIDVETRIPFRLSSALTVTEKID